MLRVLLVDDERSILEGLKKIIAWEEYGVEEIYMVLDGKSALEILENNAVDIVITDVCMEPLSGIELIRCIRKSFPEIKCMVLSGYDNFQYVKEAMSLGIENYLLKPVDKEELLSSLIQVKEKIEYEKSENQRQLANENVVRNNLLLRLINNNIPEKELLQKAETLDVVLYADFYWVAVFADTDIFTGRKVNEEERYQKMQQVVTLLKDKFSHIAYVFLTMDNQAVAIFYGNEEDLYESGKSSISRFLDMLKNIKHINIYAAIGKPVKNCMKVSESYQNAMFLIHVNSHAESNVLLEWKCNEVEEKQLDTFFSIQVSDIAKSVEEMDSERTEFLMRQFIDEVVKNGKKSIIWQMLFLQQLILNIIKPVNYKNNPELYERAENILYKIHYKQELSFGEYMNQLMELAGDTISYLKEKKANYSPLVSEIKNMIDNSYMENVSLTGIAEKYKANPVYIGQLFKNEMGEYFSDYLNKVRIENAKELLLTTQDAVVDIGMKVGYLSKTNFYTVFKKYIGMTPMEYRRYGKNE